MSKRGPKSAAFRKTVSFQALLLGISTLCATTLLSFGDLATRDAIKLRQEEDLRASIAQVIPSDLYDNELLQSTLIMSLPDGESVTVYQASKSGRVKALVFAVAESGYSGEIRSIIAVDPTGVLLGVRVLSHTETPGLGDKIEADKDDWVLGFAGLSLKNPTRSRWAVKKDGGEFDQFTGATITPRAVIKSVKSGLEFFDRHKLRLVEPIEPLEEATSNGDHDSNGIGDGNSATNEESEQ